MTEKKRESIDDMIDAHVWMAKQDKKACEAQSSELGTITRSQRCEYNGKLQISDKPSNAPKYR
jgi:hypothetical protein